MRTIIIVIQKTLLVCQGYQKFTTYIFLDKIRSHAKRIQIGIVCAEFIFNRQLNKKYTLFAWVRIPWYYNFWVIEASKILFVNFQILSVCLIHGIKLTGCAFFESKIGIRTCVCFKYFVLRLAILIKISLKDLRLKIFIKTEIRVECICYSKGQLKSFLLCKIKAFVVKEIIIWCLELTAFVIQHYLQRLCCVD